MNLLHIKNLAINIEGKERVRDISLDLKKGEIHILMGPNGAGKSTLAYAIMGHPKYSITQGTLEFEGKEIQKMKTEERAHAGIFLGFQHPVELEGVTVSNLLFTIAKQKNPNVTVSDFRKMVEEARKKVNIDAEFLKRYVNVHFSGGEKKRVEILQLLIAEPKLAILDEPDSGADSDTIKLFTTAINLLAQQGTTFLIITHYNRSIEYLEPTQVHILVEGTIKQSGSKEMAQQVEKEGYLTVKHETNSSHN